MKPYILIGLTLIIVLISGCAAPEEINKQIAETYRGLNSLSYDVQTIRTDIYDKPYIAYEFKKIDVSPFVALGDSQTLTGARCVADSSVFIEKPDKKAITRYSGYFGYCDAKIGGGQTINGVWYFKLEPSKTDEEINEICNGDTYYSIPGFDADVSVDSTEPERCKEAVLNSIWQVPATLDDPSKFKVDITKETLDGRDVIRANIESTTGEFFYIEKTIDMPFQKMIFWFNPSDFKILKVEGVLGKSKRAISERDVGLSTTYTMIFKNIVFNPDIPREIFNVDLSEYDKVINIKSQEQLNEEFEQIKKTRIDWVTLHNLLEYKFEQCSNRDIKSMIEAFIREKSDKERFIREGSLYFLCGPPFSLPKKIEEFLTDSLVGYKYWFNVQWWSEEDKITHPNLIYIDTGGVNCNISSQTTLSAGETIDAMSDEPIKIELQITMCQI